ncbi:bifunctional DNA-binding transcriptional regulator/O6-methylguanine-DNA methyltransferase Ada [Methylocella silvestris]|uniref:methylated-DNA--[protein]-cysteine S-methyltransferase n=1 Tax=Methylocella silvestris TaxID=199596 RepID=A0A2J7TK65_METSI|nr:bifunctional DNA-binding transcriptional regulator/O6-methylguanine-DNA methyltransferase Ada [Methylocella silvestris]PNG27172.1 bifunctional DNA-binding transcriptional regulator/O6-methylguanine-DNA methyltransferase Ada [Methylocella silvestris]
MDAPETALQDSGDPLEARFEAIARRDAGAGFFYGVRTTGVYCRPNCAARPARRENVAFFATGAEAERAGFRACKRCRPDQPDRAARDADAIRHACGMIDAAETPPGLKALAKAAGLSPSHFHRLFKSATGVTPRAYASAKRAERLAAGLGAAARITDAIYDAGFNSASRFYEFSNARLGMTPGDYRDGGAGADIRFAIGECSLGFVLVAATDKGVCAILIGDNRDALTRNLQERFCKARIIGADVDFGARLAQIIALVEAPQRRFDLPLDIIGTAFQQQVWQALRAIPPGTTASYADVAKAIGRPQSARAVAGACAANPIAVAIPCHRVVHSDGSLSGYRWGVDRKRALLDREKKKP